tara:strand:- start:398 stop:610 length:213 start_codon:yes stop_codon:yes gene_type:complete
MTIVVTSKNDLGDSTEFILDDGSGTYYITRQNPVTDQEVIDDLNAQNELNRLLIEEQKKAQEEIEANING